MQAPAQLNLEMWQGASWSYVLTWKTGEPLAAVNLTGYTARLQARESVADTTPALSLTLGSGITLGGSAGTVTLTRTPTQTSAIPAGRYYYDLEVESAGGQVTRLTEGTLTVYAEVTR